jgi:uncharacterized repeat protein (TIGR01451 family)
LGLIALLGTVSLPRHVIFAPAGAETEPGALSVEATIESIGIVAPYSGDDNLNSSATVWYRPVDDPVWLAGPELFVDRHAREWRGSLVHCSPATEYEVEVRYADVDGVQPNVVHASVRTRPGYPDVGSGGTVWYVPDDGDLQGLIDSASAGDTVRIRAGTHNIRAKLGPDESGAPGAYLTIEGELGAVLDGGRSVDIALELNGASYVRVRSLTFRNYEGASIRLADASHNVIEGNAFEDGGSYAVLVGRGGGSTSSDNLIQDNAFSSTGFRDAGWTWDQAGDNSAIALLLVGVGPGNVVRHNTVTGGFDGIDIRRGGSHTDIYSNVISECMDDGIEVDDEPGHNIRVWGNRISYCYSGISNQGWFEDGDRESGPVYIFRNVIIGGVDPESRTPVGSSDPYEEGYYTHYAFKVGADYDRVGRVYYYHNTIAITDPDHRGNGIQDAGGYYWAGLVARNNLWHVSGKIYNLRHESTGHDVDYNNLHSTSDRHFVEWAGDEYDDLAEFQAQTGQERHSISNGGTLFNADWSLRPGSPEIDKGCVIVGFNDRGPGKYWGPNPDIGASEFWSDPDLSASTKTASSAVAAEGGILTYTVRIANSGGRLSSTAAMTDVLPEGLDYLTNTLAATLGMAWVDSDVAPASLHWRGVMDDIPVAEIRYGVRVRIDAGMAVLNTAWIDDGLGKVIGRSATILVNSRTVYLPVILRNL